MISVLLKLVHFFSYKGTIPAVLRGTFRKDEYYDDSVVKVNEELLWHQQVPPSTPGRDPTGERVPPQRHCPHFRHQPRLQSQVSHTADSLATHLHPVGEQNSPLRQVWNALGERSGETWVFITVGYRERMRVLRREGACVVWVSHKCQTREYQACLSACPDVGLQWEKGGVRFKNCQQSHVTIRTQSPHYTN